jgi:hypothetical protein
MVGVVVAGKRSVVWACVVLVPVPVLVVSVVVAVGLPLVGSVVVFVVCTIGVDLVDVVDVVLVSFVDVIGFCVVVNFRLQGRLPSVLGHNLQCQPVRGVNTREECHRPHACLLQANMRGIQWHPRV